MYSNPLSEPIQSGGKLHEGQESEGELLVAGGDAPEYFDAGKEICDVMAVPVVTAMESSRMVAAPSRRDSTAGTLRAQIGAETIGVEALVGHDPVTPQAPPWRGHGVQVVLRAGGQDKINRPAMLVDDGGELGVQAAFGPPDGLRQMATRGIGPILMQLDMRAVQMPQHSFGAPSQSRQQAAPQATGRPAPPAGADRTPRAVVRRHVSPGTAGAQHKPYPRDHDPIIVRRPSAKCANLPSPGFAPAQDNILTASIAVAPTPIDSDTS